MAFYGASAIPANEKGDALRCGVIGTGYVGLVTAVGLAEIGHSVSGMDQDTQKISRLQQGKSPIFEQGLEALLQKHLGKQSLRFTSDIARCVHESEIIFVAVGTPPQPNGEANLEFVEKVLRDIVDYATTSKWIVIKSTVPPQTCERLQQVLDEFSHAKIKHEIISNPEFLREGRAINDFLSPDRIVVGTQSQEATAAMRLLYQKFSDRLFFTDMNSSELIKHASNSFLAMKISYANLLAQVCERVHADVVDVTRGMGLDPRIGKDFLQAGIGFGGSCFPKDVDAFVHLLRRCQVSPTLLEEVQSINQSIRVGFIAKVKRALGGSLSGKRVGVLGLAFKPHTDDMRAAPSIDIIHSLHAEGALISAFDPIAEENARPLLPSSVVLCPSPEEVLEGADSVLILTDWPQFKELDWKKAPSRMRSPILVDGRNQLDPSAMRGAGFTYFGVGRNAPL